MPLIIRAILTGFGYKIGAELGRYVAERIGLKKPEKSKEGDFPEGLGTTEDPADDPSPDAPKTPSSDDGDDDVAA